VQDGDLFAFLAIFRDLLQMFPKRLDDSDVDKLAKGYFAALRRFTIPQIQAGADVWVQRGKFFPKPAEWRESIPRTVSAATALVELGGADAAEYLDAERKAWEGEPCDCRACRDAGVSHRFLRYVPESDENGIEARGLISTRTVVRGHWAHGEELARWYVAKEKFWADFRALVTRLSMPKTCVQPEPEAEPEAVA
jgi:hypothetical protein